MNRRVGVVLLTAVVGGAAVTGCGNRQSAFAAVHTAGPKTTAAHTARVVLAITVQGVSGVPAGSGGVRSSGAFDFTGHKGHLTVETGAMKLETVMIGTTIYEKVPPQLAQGAAAGKPWIKLDLADAGKLTGVDLGGLSQESSGDPSQSLALLEGASKNVVKLGSDTVRGAATTHYRAAIDPKLASERAPAAQKQAVQRLSGIFDDQTVPVDVWIDAEGRVRKMTYALDLKAVHLPGPAAGLQGTLESTFEAYDFGVPVDATAPPPDQVTDVAALVKTGMG